MTLSANPSTVNNGAASTLSWSATNATSCTASGGWSGSQAISGSVSTSVLSATTAYTLSCTGTGGTTVQSATVTVTASTTASTGTATLSWVPPTENTDGTPVTTLTGYHIYYGTSEGALTQSIAASGATTIELRNQRSQQRNLVFCGGCRRGRRHRKRAERRGFKDHIGLRRSHSFTFREIVEIPRFSSSEINSPLRRDNQDRQILFFEITRYQLRITDSIRRNIAGFIERTAMLATTAIGRKFAGGIFSESVLLVIT